MKGLSKRIEDLFRRTVEDVVRKDELAERLASGKKLRIKYGVDVTAPFLHLGHAVNLWLMRAFQEEGHKVVFLVGDFTTKIGDPTGRMDARPVIPDEEIEKNAEEFKRQAAQILLTDSAVFEERRNSEWYDTMGVRDFVRLLGEVTHAQLIERDMFQERIRAKKEIYAHELIYPLLQGYDSVALESDFTVIGSDQLFNEMMGRAFQERHGQKPQVIATTRITPGIHGGPKQSKSLGNYIGLSDPAQEKFGKVMSIPDDLIIPYFEVYTERPLEDIKEKAELLASNDINPMAAKLELASTIVERYHGAPAAEKAREFFKKTFQKGEIPETADIRNIRKGDEIIKILTDSKLVPSASEARRLLRAGSVEFEGETISDPHFTVERGGVLRIGKKKFVKLELQ